MQQESLEQERAWAERVRGAIAGRLKTDRAEEQDDRHRLLALRRYMWEDTEHDAMSSNQKLELHRQEEAYAVNVLEQRRLQTLSDEPYFARIDFREEGQRAPEKIYIGRFGLMDERTMDFWVYDWRSPVASMFYDAEYGPASYECPAGRIDGEISLRRQYVFDKGKLQGMFDASVEVQDEILKQILSRSADEKMKTIVTTIQKEQNRAIRDNDCDVLVIEGPAGSGKTSIALHRIAYLLYHYRKTLRSDEVLLFSQSDVLSYYISDVLPALGERQVPTATFGELAAHALGLPAQSGFSALEAMLSGGVSEEDVRRARRKGSAEFAGYLDRMVEDISQNGIGFSEIDFEGRPVMTADELKADFCAFSKRLTVAERLRKVRADFYARLRQLRGRRLPELARQLIGQKGETFYLNRRELERDARLRWYHEFLKLEAAYNQKNMTDAFALYLRAAADVFGADEPDAVRRGTAGGLRYEDLAPLTYLACLLGQVRPLSGVRHVVVDEAQDVSFVQCRILATLFRETKFTILGDSDQALSAGLAHRDLSYIVEAFRGRRTGRLRLDTSYRPTAEIGRFTAALLGRQPPKLIDRHGQPPKVVRVADEREAARAAREFAQRLQKGESAAIITKTAGQAEELFGRLGLIEAAGEAVRLMVSENGRYTGGLAVMPSWLAKGLEFDSVLVVNTRRMEPNLLYVCCTRALHRLELVESADASRPQETGGDGATT